MKFELEALRLRFEDLRRENERLRDARSAITSQLGPLPISATIVAGLVSGFSVDGKAHLDHTLAHWALGVFGLMVLVSILSSTLKPYRRLRDDAEAGAGKPKPGEAKTAAEWYRRMIAIEEAIRGKTKSGVIATVARLVPVPLPWRAKTL